MARVDAIRRQVGSQAATIDNLREAFSAAESLMQSYFPDFKDPALRIPAYRAECEVRLGKDMNAARGVWEATLKTPASRYMLSPHLLLLSMQTLYFVVVLLVASSCWSLLPMLR